MTTYINQGIEFTSNWFSGNEPQSLENKKALLEAELKIKIISVASAALALLTLHYALPAFSVIGTAFGVGFGIIAYDLWKVGNNLGKNPNILEGLSILKEAPMEARLKSVREKFNRIFQDTIIIAPVLDYTWRYVEIAYLSKQK